MNIEKHPRLNLDNLKLVARKIILGSFPAISEPKNNKPSVVINNFDKLNNRRTAHLPYFFGSLTNRFWHWYNIYVDLSININDSTSLSQSIQENNIGITDIILSCERKGRSSLDKNLSNRLYNHDFFHYPNEGETLKILCTSKGLLNEMLINKMFFKTHPCIKLSTDLSQSFQRFFLNQVDGIEKLVIKPICIVLEVEDGGLIECLAIPSPGSPYRKLDNFGYSGKDFDKFLQVYLERSFSWFMDY